MGSLATGRVSGWRTALKVGRVSNLPTVWSNVIAGSALVGGAPLHLVATLAIAISGMYVAGMFLNDAFDREIDARERPERPIPAGEITADAVVVVGASLLIAGMVSLAAINDRVGLAGLVLGAAILLYNWHHKGNPFAPFVMGLCRALVYVAAASAVTVTPPQAVLISAAATLAYVAGLTYVARLESLDRIGSLWPLLMLSAPVAVGLASTDFSLAGNRGSRRHGRLRRAGRQPVATARRRRRLARRGPLNRCHRPQRCPVRHHNGSHLCGRCLPRLLRAHPRLAALCFRKLNPSLKPVAPR